MEEIHELGDRISKQKEEGRYYDEEIARNATKRQEYERIAKDYARRSAEGEEQLRTLRGELARLQEEEASAACAVEL